MSYLTGLLENEDLYVGTERGKPKEQLGPQTRKKGIGAVMFCWPAFEA